MRYREHRGSAIRLTCPNDGDVIIYAATALATIDPENGVYRFTCSKCDQGIEKRCTVEIYDILRRAGIPTIDELCESFGGLLANDSNVWRGLLAV